MRYAFTGKNMSIYDELKDKTEKKLDRLQKLLPSDDIEVSVAFSKMRHQYKIEVSVPMHRRMLRAEVVASEPSACVDAVVDILEKQIVKYKGRLRERVRRSPVSNEELSFINEHSEPEPSNVIHRTKRFAVKPMDAQEAVMEMELVGHSFFVFRNDSTDEINVVYKRNDGEYGLIEPQ